MLVIRLFVVLLLLAGAATAQDVAVSGTENLDRKSSDDQSEKADYVRELEDVISARTRSIEYLDYMLSASRRRFGQMNELDQELAIQSFERVKKEGVANAKKEDIDRIRGLGFTEATDLASQFDDQAAQRAGVSRLDRQDVEANRQDAMARDAAARQGAGITGEDAEDVIKRAQQPVQVELFDKKTFEIVLNRQDDVLFNAIVDKIEKNRADSDAELKRRIDELDKQKQTAEAERARLAREAGGI